MCAKSATACRGRPTPRANPPHNSTPWAVRWPHRTGGRAKILTRQQGHARANIGSTRHPLARAPTSPTSAGGRRTVPASKRAAGVRQSPFPPRTRAGLGLALLTRLRSPLLAARAPRPPSWPWRLPGPGAYLALSFLGAPSSCARLAAYSDSAPSAQPAPTAQDRHEYREHGGRLRGGG
jgi:hypothetical protein